VKAAFLACSVASTADIYGHSRYWLQLILLAYHMEELREQALGTGLNCLCIKQDTNHQVTSSLILLKGFVQPGKVICGYGPNGSLSSCALPIKQTAISKEERSLNGPQNPPAHGAFSFSIYPWNDIGCSCQS
jgi:hypothetical protein